MAKAKEISIEDIVGSKDTQLTKPKTNKKEKEMTKLYKSTKFTIAATVIVTALVIFGGYKLHEFVYNQGYNAAISEQASVQKLVSAQLKQNQ